MTARPPRTPYVLLALLTLLTVGGPLAIAYTMNGGLKRGWPPDRAIEWWVFGLVIGGYVALMGTCLGVGLIQWRRTIAGSSRVLPLSRDKQS